jgi:hypothetical protein
MAITFPANPANGETHTHNGQIYVYNSTRGYWLLKKSADVSVQQAQRSTFVATASQTTHSVVYDAGSPVVVSVNGAMLNPSDFTAENGTSITFETALTVNDEVDIVFYQPTTSNLTRHSVSDTAPSGASSGDLWFNSANLKTYVYYDDGSSVQWVALNAVGADGAAGSDGSSVTAYANLVAFPSLGNTEGDFAFAQDTKALYVWDGTEWDKISSGNDESPIIITEPPTTHTLNIDGTTSTVTMVAEDPEGFDISYGIVYKTAGNTRPVQLSTDTTVNTSGVYTFTPTTNPADAGNFTVRLSASDGSRTTTRLIDFKLEFIPQRQNIIGWYEFADTNSYNTAVSTTVLNDLSGNSNNQTISNPGSLSGDGHLTFSTNSTINFGGSMSGQKTWAIISRPPTGYNMHVLFGTGSADAGYYSVFHNSQGTDYYGYQTAWAGETVVDTVNGIYPNNNRNTSYNALTLGQSNSIITTGLQMASSAMVYNAYPTWTATHEVYAFVFWDVVLTLSEIQKVHDYYRNKIGAANMAVWQG